jgi:hypothetical protein
MSIERVVHQMMESFEDLVVEVSYSLLLVVLVVGIPLLWEAHKKRKASAEWDKMVIKYGSCDNGREGDRNRNRNR